MIAINEAQITGASCKLIPIHRGKKRPLISEARYRLAKIKTEVSIKSKKKYKYDR